MKKVFLIISLFLVIQGCSSQPSRQDSYFPDQSTVFRQPDQYKQIIRRYPPPKILENEAPVFKSFSSLPEVKIAFLVPLSGKYEKIGQNLLDAAQLALFSVDEPNLILLPIDTKGTSYGAVEAANKAVEQGAKIILGPLFGGSAKEVASIAAEKNISIVSFSNDKSLAGTGVFAIGFRPEQQISRIIEFAMQQGIEDFTAVLPNDLYGAAAAKEMRETVAANDMASVLKTEIYRVGRDGKAAKLRGHVFSAFNSAINTKPPKDYDDELKAYNFNPIRYPRAMLIAEGGQRLKDISNLLKKYRHDKSLIQLLGTEQWYSDEVLTNPVLDGAWFSTAPDDRRKKFHERFSASFGYEPAKIASLAYDAIALTATIARISSGEDFSKEALMNPRGFYGVDGIFRFKEDGLTERGLAVMRINNGQFEIVSPAPTNFVEVKNEQDGGGE